MALVVFMRGVNVGGHRTFQPAALARELASLGVVNVGAAGTFVVRKAITQSKLRAELLRRMPFEPQIMICRAAEIGKLADSDTFPNDSGENVQRFVSVMAKAPRQVPELPIAQPPGEQWQVQIVGIRGRFALSLWRKQPRGTLLYPNEVVEKRFGVPATTRNWNTITAINEILSDRRP